MARIMISIYLTSTIIAMSLHILNQQICQKLKEHTNMRGNRRRDVIKKRSQRNDDGKPLLPDLNDETLTQNNCCCKTCDQMTAFSFCFECKDVYCESCCDHHVKEAPSHTIFQVKHIETDSQSVKCMTCSTGNPIKVCFQCKRLLCTQCLCDHVHKSLLIDNETINKKDCEHCIVKIDGDIGRSFTIPIPVDKLHVPTRICGFVILDEDRIVIADYSNRVLRVLSVVKTGKTFAPIILAGEPRGIARMFDSRFAVTFPHDRKIQIFDVKSGDPSSSMKDKLDMHSYGKPFSITYNQDTFAVEIDEREDGYILIITIDGVCLHKIHEAKQYAYFTGHTIRLALDKANQRLFISAMSKRAVTCIDFKGERKWSEQFTSPRGLFFLPDLDKLILASKRRNAIYQLNTLNGNGRILASCGDIISPRYIAYDKRTKLLCVQTYGDDDEDRIVVMKYK
ncbi:uncharacterized protein LOC143064128 isoform X2 [Mytilus galloprovincialis]|uniref:uncharacterized protein LOC143064128 isoform X2 n=1 Tax=Mytilus galloprovincialis TaxID=29158 RepID=UPI003F7B6771